MLELMTSMTCTLQITCAHLYEIVNVYLDQRLIAYGLGWLDLEIF